MGYRLFIRLSVSLAACPSVGRMERLAGFADTMNEAYERMLVHVCAALSFALPV